jgi:Protein of unknown function (DUF3592)
VARAVAAEGRVVDLAAVEGESTTYAPVIEFMPQNAGTPVRFRHPVATSPSSFHVGQAVLVLHDPLEHSTAMIDQGLWATGMPFIPGADGLLFMLMGLHNLYAARRRVH